MSDDLSVAERDGTIMSLSSFAQLAAKFATAEADIKLAQEAALEKSCQLLEDRGNAAIGTYEFGWEPLKQVTIDRKTKGDTPLLETGALRDLIFDRSRG
jgi:hypothetical protein